MYRAIVSYFKGLFGLHPQEPNYYYFNPEGDFQDIRGLSPIEDMSLVPFLILFIIILCLIGWGVYKMIKYLKYKKSIQPQVLARKYLLALDKEDAKSCAYTFSKWASHLVEDNNIAKYENLEERLFKYKYKKNTQPLSSKEKEELDSFLKVNHG